MNSEPFERVKAKTLILDANILVRAVLGRRVLSTLKTFADRVNFLAPEVAFEDARRYLPVILANCGHSQARAEELLERLVTGQLAVLVTPVPQEVYVDFENEARRRLAVRDEQDWPYIALALVTGSPIWTEDQDFFGCGVPTWTTDRVEICLNADNK